MHRHEPKLERLAHLALFRGITNRQLHEVAKLATEMHVPAGTVLCREGEIGRQFFVIAGGEAAVTIGNDEVATLLAGDFFGELALLDGAPRVASVTASTDLELYVLSRPEFDGLLASTPIVARRILGEMASRLRIADLQLHDVRMSA